MKDLSYLALLDIYGNSLTDKQRRVLEDYYERDYSLSEIADNINISRQAVHYAIKQAEESLKSQENNFGVYAFVKGLYKKLDEAKRKSEDGTTAESIAEIEEYVRSHYGTVWQP